MKLTDEQRAAFGAVVIGTSDAEFERDPLGAMERLFAAGIAHAQAWRPIATAPKDGTAILGWDPSVSTMIPIEWDAQGRYWTICWDGYITWDCTHWLPLPPAPEEGK